MPSLTSLMSGGWDEGDYDFDIIGEEDIAREKAQDEAEEMSLPVLLSAFEDALWNGNDILASIYEDELASRDGSKEQNEEDRRKDYLENYAADEMGIHPVEEDELPY